MADLYSVDPLVKEIAWALQYGELRDSVGRSLVRIWHEGAADQHIKSMIWERIRRLRMKQASGELVPFAVREMTQQGDMILGTDLRGQPLRCPSQGFNGHSLTVSGSGGGKTFKARSLILEIADKVMGLWGFDFVKAEFAPLKPHLAQMGINLHRVPARKIRLNPLQVPKHVFPLDWAPRIADVFVQTLQLPPRATKLLHLKILELYHQRGIIDGSQNFPTIFHLRDAIASDTNANSQARSAILDSIDPVLMSIGDVLRYVIGWTGYLAQHHIVFELGGVSEVDKNLLLNTLVLPEFVSRVARGISNPTMDLWICCDEAGRLISSTNRGGTMADLISQIRGTGIGLDLSTQSADVSSSVLSNTANKFIGRVTNATDLNAIGAAMALSPEQRQWINLNLRPGMFVGQFGEGDRRPFVYKVARMHLDVAVDEEASAGGLEELMAIPTEPAEEYKDWRPNHIIRVPSVRKDPNEPEETPSADGRSSIARVSKEELDYLQSVATSLFMGATQRDKNLGISSWKGNKIRKQLLKKYLVSEAAINPGGRGRKFSLLQISEEGEPFLKSYGIRVSNGHGRGSGEHQWWAWRISTWLKKKGFEVAIEDESLGARVDIAVETEQGMIAIEVETSRGREVENISKDLEVGFSKVVSLLKDANQVEKLRAKLAKQIPEKLPQVQVGNLTEYAEILEELFCFGGA